MKTLHVNQQIGTGGAAGISLALHSSILALGYESTMLVGRKSQELHGVGVIEQDSYRSAWGELWMGVAKWLNDYNGRFRGAQRLSERWIPFLASPQRFWYWLAGYEDFDFPGINHLLEQAPFIPDLLHLHNLHGDYFDLRQLPLLSKSVPTIITLHDAWLLAGHCAHSFDCDRWKTGCGCCPGLDILPLIRRDGSAFNWRRKQKIYEGCRLSLVCPSEWLADKVRHSMLMPCAIRLEVIHNGVNTSLYKPGDKMAVRIMLGWPQDAFIVVFAANTIRQSIWKDYTTMREAIRLAGEKVVGRRICFYAIGEASHTENVGNARIEFLPYRDSMVECYQAADVYIHAAKADTFPTTIIESLACGIPVVATAVGGIPEQIIEGNTGFLVPPGDAASMADRLVYLSQSPELLSIMGSAASRDAAKRFSLKEMTNAYIKLYQDMIDGAGSILSNFK
ncbi:MAG: glycosyltransferase [Chlorobiaceae bacterium]